MSIEGVLFVLVMGLVSLMLFTGIAMRGGYLTAPFLVAASFAGWAMPQMLSLHVQGLAPNDSMGILLLMSLLCLAAFWAGWWLALRNPKHSLNRGLVRLHDRSVGACTLVLTAIAGIGFVGLGLNPAEENGSMWTGQATIYYFLLNLKSASLALSLMMFLQRRSLLTTALVTINLFFYFPYIFLMFKRRQIAELALAVSYAFLMIRNVVVPRVAVVVGMVAASLAFFAAAEIRKSVNMGSWSEIAEIDLVSVNPLADDDVPEMTNAAYLVAVASWTGEYTLGGELWNRLVFQFVPGQIVGMEIKENLMVSRTPESQVFEGTGYVPRTGTTFTGIATAYSEFWYFGCIYFLLAGYVLGTLWKRAFAGNLWDKAWYVVAIVPGTLMVPMSAQYFFVSLIVFLFFMTVTNLLIKALQARRSLPAPQLPSLSRS